MSIPPSIDVYKRQSETHYQGWDITEALDGSDTIAVGVLARWYGNGQGRAGGTQGLLGQIVVYYDDGSTQVISTCLLYTSCRPLRRHQTHAVSLR